MLEQKSCSLDYFLDYDVVVLDALNKMWVELI